MNPYVVREVQDGKKTYYYLRYMETYSIEPLPAKYLNHKVSTGQSPNTVKESALALSYYYSYLWEKEMELSDVYALPYDTQSKHFVDFLYWLKLGNHNGNAKKTPLNSTCNTYLRDVFDFYRFLESLEPENHLKVFVSRLVSVTNSIGVAHKKIQYNFQGFLKEEEHKRKFISREEIEALLLACTNCRDQLLLLLLAETGFRIGELLGVSYTRDIDYSNHTIQVHFRDDNENKARAKYAEYRRAKISLDTFDFLLYYLSEYRNLLKDTEYLFIVIEGNSAGNPLSSNTVYSMLKRLEKKTGIKATPHMLRRYFATQRRNGGWDILLLSKALGHKHIKTTEQYIKVEDSELEQATDKFYEKNKALFMVEQL